MVASLFILIVLRSFTFGEWHDTFMCFILDGYLGCFLYCLLRIVLLGVFPSTSFRKYGELVCVEFSC